MSRLFYFEEGAGIADDGVSTVAATRDRSQSPDAYGIFHLRGEFNLPVTVYTKQKGFFLAENHFVLNKLGLSALQQMVILLLAPVLTVKSVRQILFREASLRGIVTDENVVEF